MSTSRTSFWDEQAHMASLKNPVARERPPASRIQESFPVKLMHILQLIDTKEPELAHIISWQPNGITFHIHDKKLFEKLVKQPVFSIKRVTPRSISTQAYVIATIARSGSSKTMKQVTTTTKTSTSCAVSATGSSYEDTASITDSTRFSIGADDTMQSKEYQFYGTVRKPTFPTFPSIDEEKAKQYQPMPTFDMDEGHDFFDIRDCFDFDDDNEPLSFFFNA